MKLGEITQPLLKLLEDTGEAEAFLDKHNTQFARRAYIRSIFAYIEGAIWLLKQSCLRVVLEQKVRILKPADYALLKDVGFELKSNGEPFEQPKFLRLPENVRFTFRTFNRLFSASIDLGIGSKKWDDFLAAIAMRHRVTHPKNPTDIDISDAEIEKAKEVSGWFNEIVSNCIETMHDKPSRPESEA
jgi:hypothetical protein